MNPETLVIIVLMPNAMAGVYKCIKDGNTSYSEKPCPEETKSIKLNISRSAKPKISPEDILLAKVTPSCTTSGFGQVRCSFLNNTKKTASICVIAQMKRNKSFRYYKNSNYNKYSAIVKTSKICTGVLFPNSLIERSASFAGKDNDVNMLCRPRASDDDWRDFCDMTIKAVSK